MPSSFRTCPPAESRPPIRFERASACLVRYLERRPSRSTRRADQNPAAGGEPINDPARTITITDALTHPTVVTHNPRGQVLTIKNALDHTTTLGYDVQGNLTSIKDPVGQHHHAGL